MKTYGISSGKTSDKIFIESVFVLDVGAAANKIFNNAIWNYTEMFLNSMYRY